MDEIRKTTPGVGQQTPQQIEPVKMDASQEPQVSFTSGIPQIKEINEIPDNPADRSVVKPADTIENDLKAFADNPKLVEAATNIGDIAFKGYTEAGVENAPEKAAALERAFFDEFNQK